MIRSVILDGTGSGNEVEVTRDHALRVTTIESSSVSIDVNYLKNSSGSEVMKVDGSVTPVDFYLQSSESTRRTISWARFVFEGASMNMGGSEARKFGDAAGVGGLTNGVRFFLEQSGAITDLFLSPVQHMADFWNYCDDWENVVNAISNTEDHLSWTFVFTKPVVLPVGGNDRVVVRISDNLTALTNFWVILRGWQELA